MTLLTATDVTRVFGEGRTLVTAVDRASFEIDGGEVVLLLGPSGSGKTTLLSMIGGLLRPSSGEIRIDGRAVDELDRTDPSWRLRTVGFVFQSFNLMPALTAAQNIALPLRLGGVKGGVAEERARALLADLGLRDRADLRPSVLSGGEKQRVSIARALLTKPKLLLADEPTANLDGRHGQAAMELLTSLARQGQQACLIVTHDHRLRPFADRVLTIEDGIVVNNGSS